jgi:hypothetical protein
MNTLSIGIRIFSLTLFAWGFIWALLLAYRKSMSWFLGVLLLPVPVYIIFSTMNWQTSKWATWLMLGGVAIWISPLVFMIVLALLGVNPT